MLAKSPFQLRSLLCIHVCQGLLCWKRQEKLWPEFSLGNCQDGRTARGQQQKKFFKKNLRHKTTRSLRGPGRRNICFENIAKNKSWLNKGALWNSLQNGERAAGICYDCWSLRSKGRHVSHFGELSTLMHYSKSRQTFPSLHRITIN